jgi:DNA-directed RNA polymerase specialized sigma24 family protein
VKKGPGLLKAAQKLDEEALTAIFDRRATIYKYTLRLCHDQIVADNIVGDVLATWAIDRAGHRTSLRSYLYQTAYHLVVDRHAIIAQCSLEIAMSNYGWSFAPTQSQVRNVMMEALISAMNTDLTEDQRHDHPASWRISA